MELAGLALAWLAYALLHSILASFAVKDWVARRWPAAAPYYRLGFNIVAVVTALPLAWLLYAIPGEPLWRWSGAVVVDRQRPGARRHRRLPRLDPRLRHGRVPRPAPDPRT